MRNSLNRRIYRRATDGLISFVCGRGQTFVVVEIKRPGLKASIKHLDQIEEQVNFARDYISKTTDPELQYKTATGYLLCGNLVDTFNVRGKSVKGGGKVDHVDELAADLWRLKTGPSTAIHRLKVEPMDGGMDVSSGRVSAGPQGGNGGRHEHDSLVTRAFRVGSAA